METSYLALLRGVNVGGNNKLPMADLKAALTEAGLTDVRTYIQSGNVLFRAAAADTMQLARQVEQVIQDRFQLQVDVVVFSKQQWQKVVDNAPKWWGKDSAWKHNLLILLPPFAMPEVVKAVGELKPDIESMEPGEGVLYQSMSLKLFGRTTTGKLASNPVYKRMTIRNYNTSIKLLDLL